MCFCVYIFTFVYVCLSVCFFLCCVEFLVFKYLDCALFIFVLSCFVLSVSICQFVIDAYSSSVSARISSKILSRTHLAPIQIPIPIIMTHRYGTYIFIYIFIHTYVIDILLNCSMLFFFNSVLVKIFVFFF